MKNSWQHFIFIVFGLLCVFSWYFYRPQIISYYNQGMENSQELSSNSWTAYSSIFKDVSFPALKLSSLNYNFPSYQFQKFTLPSFNLPTFPTLKLPALALEWPSFKLPSLKLPFLNYNLPSLNSKLLALTLPNFDFKLPMINLFSAAKQPVQETIKATKDCGTSAALDLNDPATFENNPTLACLGASAINCENAKGVIKDDLFPTVFEISRSQNSCSFKLSYPADSALTDVTGAKLAGQYISCPVYIVKMIDNANPSAPKFISPDKTDFSKYGSEIYFYGTLGVFVENNLDKNKMEASGCGGSYIDSMIAGYNLSRPK